MTLDFGSNHVLLGIRANSLLINENVRFNVRLMSEDDSKAVSVRQ